MRRWGGLATFVGVLIALGTLAPGAEALIKQLPNGKAVSYQPLRGKVQAAPKQFDSAFSNLDYNGGPVMAANTDYFIFWKPAAYASNYPSDYRPGLEQYFTDLAHDSGGHQNVDSIASQYNDAAGNLANYNMSYGGAFTDTAAYPANGCGAGAVNSGVVCLTDAQLQAELRSFVTARGLPHDTRHEYFLVFPPGVQNCFDNNPNDGCSVGANPPFGQYCAYHGATTVAPSSTAIIYSNDPYVTGNFSCDTGQHPNGTSDGALQGGLSHEHNESITDPFPNTAWADLTSGGAENGDKCGGSFGAPLGTAPNGSPYNQVINGHEYLYQREWSNQGHTCLQRFTFSGVEPTAQFTSTPGSGNTMNFDATGSTAPGGVADYHWQYEDTVTASSAEFESTSPTASYTYGSAGHHTVSLTVYAPDGTSYGASRVISAGAPVVAFTAAPTQVAAGSPVGFDGSSSNEPGGSISSYSWDFGDGATAGGVTASHVYARAGTYTVTLSAADPGGNAGQATRQVVVVGVPSALITGGANPVAGKPEAFSGTGSTDNGSAISSYSWNFGDGGVGSGATVSHAFTHAGSYIATLTVTDASGASNTATKTLAVAAALPPVASAAIASVSIKKGKKLEKLTLTITGPGTVSLGRRKFKVTHARRLVINVKLSNAQRNQLRHRRALKIKLTFRFEPTVGSSSSKTVRFTIKG